MASADQSAIRSRFRRARRYVTADGLGPFLVRAVAGSGAVRVGTTIASFLVGVQLARGLGVAGYGYYGIALSVVSIAGVPAEMALPPLVTREVAAADARADQGRLLGVLRWASGLAARLSAAMALLLLVAALVLHFLRPSPLVLALAAGAWIIPFTALAKIDCGALRGLHQIVRSQLPNGVAKPLAMSLLLFSVYLAGLSLHPWMAVGLNAISAAGAWILAAAWLKQRLPVADRIVETRDRSAWAGSMVPMALSQGMQTLEREMSVLLLGLLLAAAQVGLFRIATATAVVLAAPQAIVFMAAGPLMSRLFAQGDHGRLQALLTRSAQAQFAGVLLLSLPLLIAPEPILTLVYGRQYAPAADVLRIILVGQLITVAFGLNATVLTMTKHERRVTRAVAVSLVLNAVSFVVLVPLWGITGAAVGYVVSILAWNIITWLDARRLLRVDTSVLPIAPALAHRGFGD